MSEKEDPEVDWGQRTEGEWLAVGSEPLNKEGAQVEKPWGVGERLNIVPWPCDSLIREQKNKPTREEKLSVRKLSTTPARNLVRFGKMGSGEGRNGREKLSN